jgi:hypothetical protein
VLSCTQSMSSIGRVGFFHFGSDEKEDPIGALTSAIEKWFREQRSNPIGAIPELTDTLLVLPEGFNVLNGYYAPKPELDANACFRLKALSTTRGITFVVGLIEKLKGQNSAYLIDGNTAPQLLSRKRTIGAGTLDLYAPCQTFEEEAVLHRGIGITALLCDDAGLSGERRPELTKFRRLQCGSKGSLRSSLHDEYGLFGQSKAMGGFDYSRHGEWLPILPKCHHSRRQNGSFDRVWC